MCPKYWNSLFGLPKNIFSDNGGEFVPTEFIDFYENFNNSVKATAAVASWSIMPFFQVSL